MGLQLWAKNWAVINVMCTESYGLLLLSSLVKTGQKDRRNYLCVIVLLQMTNSGFFFLVTPGFLMHLAPPCCELPT